MYASSKHFFHGIFLPILFEDIWLAIFLFRLGGNIYIYICIYPSLEPYIDTLFSFNISSTTETSILVCSTSLIVCTEGIKTTRANSYLNKELWFH